MEWSHSDSDAGFAAGGFHESVPGEPSANPGPAPQDSSFSGPSSSIELVQSRLESISSKLRALEAKLLDTQEFGEQVRERLIDALERLDASFAQHQQAATDRMEHLISSLSGAVEDLRIQTRADSEHTTEMLWEGVGKLESKVSRIESSGRETQDRLARAVATLTVAADEWRSVTPGLFEGPSKEIQESLAKLDDTVALSGEDLAERLDNSLKKLDGAVARNKQDLTGRLEQALGATRQELADHLDQSVGALADTVLAWKDEIVYSSNRNDEKIWTGLAGLEANLSAQADLKVASGLRDLETKLNSKTTERLEILQTRVVSQTEQTLSAGVKDLTEKLIAQMKALEARVNERQAAMITLIIGGGMSSGMGPVDPPELSNLPPESIDDQA